MYMIVFIIFITLISARSISGYDRKYNKRKYFVLQNKMISKILLPKSISTGRGSRKRCKTDFNKMTYVGAVFYLCNLLLILSIPIFLYLVPEIQTQPYEVDSRTIYIWVDTVNEKLPVLLSLILLAVEFIFDFIYEFIQAKKQNEKAMIVFSCIFIVMGILLLVSNIHELLSVFIKC